MSSMSNIHSHKTKQQLINQCDVLQSLANDLSMTIEQKEEILNSLRFANSFFRKTSDCFGKITSNTTWLTN